MCSVYVFILFLYIISTLGGARNRAIAMSSGEYLCIQDSDDIMLPERLRLQVKFLSSDATKKHRSYQLIFSSKKILKLVQIILLVLK